jgi:hypothetical protein
LCELVQAQEAVHQYDVLGHGLEAGEDEGAKFVGHGGLDFDAHHAAQAPLL